MITYQKIILLKSKQYAISFAIIENKTHQNTKMSVTHKKRVQSEVDQINHVWILQTDEKYVVEWLRMQDVSPLCDLRIVG